MRISIPSAACASLLMFLVVNTGWAAPVELLRQQITLPADAGEPLFVDVDGDGRADLLVIDRAEKKLFNYHQRQNGFNNSPDQIIPLPPQTAWAAPCDVEAHPGLELLFSTAGGLVYSRQNAGLFGLERHILIETNQTFSNFDFPVLTKLSTNGLIPVISAGQPVLYHRNHAYEWSPGSSLTPSVKQTIWNAKRDLWRGQWTLGANPAGGFNAEQFFVPTPEAQPDESKENETIRKLMDAMKKDGSIFGAHMKRMDVDGDGREDLVMWHASGKLDFKTDIFIFLRGADQKLPERPTQTLHCRGFPIPSDSSDVPSPFIDLKGDGHYELVLLELKSSFTSVGGAVDVLLSHGVDWALTIRTCQHGIFSHSADASIPLTGLFTEFSDTWSFFIQGDFNGDGRPDLFIKRSNTRWNIYFSTTDGSWFAPQPGMTFDEPGHGYIEISDLNGDGLSDIIFHEMDKPELSIFMSPTPPAKGKNP